MITFFEFYFLDMNLQTQLEKVFGFKSLKPFQQQVIDSMLMDEDILVISPTGSGKSLCFQLPALLCEGMTIVLSPLEVLFMTSRSSQTKRYHV